MKASMNLKSVGIALLVIAGLTACDKPGPAESAGKKIDQTASDAGKALTNATEKVGDKMSEQSAKTGVAIDDAEITAKIKGSIFAEPGLKTLQISVDTVKIASANGKGTIGMLTIGNPPGFRTAHAFRAAAVKSLAAAVAGVTQVDNRLVVK